MHAAQRDVQRFHEALGLVVGETPQIREGKLRARLLLEEAVETAVALAGRACAMDIVGWELAGLRSKTLEGTSGAEGTASDGADLVEAVDGICDTIFVAYGTAVALGIDLEPFWNEVVASNMTKVGGPVREDGKVMKSANWQPPRIRELLEKLSRADAVR